MRLPWKSFLFVLTDRSGSLSAYQGIKAKACSVVNGEEAYAHANGTSGRLFPAKPIFCMSAYAQHEPFPAEDISNTTYEPSFKLQALNLLLPLNVA